MFVIKLDKERHAKVTNNNLKEFKGKTGKDILNLTEDQILDMSDIETLLWICLKHEDPELTLEQVQNEAELHQLRQFASYISEGKQSVNPS